MIDPTTHKAGFSAMAGLNMPRTAGRMPGINDDAFRAALSAPAKTTTPTAASETTGTGFVDFLKGLIDVINPLQHIPVISTFYRDLTGDEISPVARVAGKALYGGPIGIAIAMGDVAYEHATGKDIGATMLAAARTEPAPATTETPPVQIAAQQPEKTPASPTAAPVVAEKNTPPLLQAQEAAHDPITPDMPPDFLAARMIAALDQYQSMKKDGLSPQISARH